ncbi:chaperone protein DnaJ 1 [Marmoricola endophyticus]|uniref:Chaperone protein DnaJ n=1 Tax=Marmoricola endophyticus TaxID=2040280 RepID=A0A917F2P1_9ACTN|nr:molecular chaperone DnaJ [Marmoricola endophyticus]GGF44832.1 chaperone protein DnaJ 1 [Marmoricola endophyticus]
MSSADWATKDFYAVLGVPKDADASAIKKAYRKLARENHPDSHPDDAKRLDRFKEVAEAYDVVGDKAKRKEYDDLREQVASGGFGGGFGGGAGGGFPGGFGGGYGRGGTSGQGFPGADQGFDISDLFGGMFGGGAAGGGAGRRTRAAQPRRGADLETETTIAFADSVEGTTLKLRLSSDAPCTTCRGTGGKPGTKPHVCPTCEGAGSVASVSGGFMMNEPCPQCHGRQLVYDEPCPTCHGTGRGVSDRTVSARIPAGVKDGQKIRLKGKGTAGENGGPAGDLMVTVHVRSHAVFARKGDNLTVEVPITFDEAVLGAEVKVPTLGGAPVTLKVAPGTPSGRTMRVRGRGVHRKDNTRGDLLVTVEVQVPGAPTTAQREAAEAFRAASDGADPRAALFASAGTGA